MCIYMSICMRVFACVPVFIFIFMLFLCFLSEYHCVRTVYTSFPLHMHISKTNKRFDHKKRKPSDRLREEEPSPGRLVGQRGAAGEAGPGGTGVSSSRTPDGQPGPILTNDTDVRRREKGKLYEANR